MNNKNLKILLEESQNEFKYRKSKSNLNIPLFEKNNEQRIDLTRVFPLLGYDAIQNMCLVI